MDAELRQVANGFDYKVRSFDKYDINGYRFRTYGKELSMAKRTRGSHLCKLGTLAAYLVTLPSASRRQND